MPTLEKITENLINQNIHRAAADVFKIMLERAIEPVAAVEADPVMPWPAPQAAPEPETPLIIGQVGYAGAVCGVAFIYFELPFAHECVCKLLGVTPQELDELGHDAIKDAIGELTNMTVGSFKNGLCDAGYPCKLTIPAVFSVVDFKVAAKSTAKRYTHVFNSLGRRLVIDVLMKAED
jgi:chemotaxis protein CheX